MTDKYGNEVTEETWSRVDLAIKLFIRTYPLHWSAFKRDLLSNRTEYQMATEGDLRKAGFRNTLSFPVSYRRLSEEEKKDNPTGTEVEFLESLKDTLEQIIPGFTAPDADMGKANESKVTQVNRLYKEFVRRYAHMFGPGEKQ